MIRHRFDPENWYLSTFDDVTGEYIRSNVYDQNGKDTNTEPFMGDFPHLLDIGIKGFCEHGLSGRCLDTGVYCYQRGGDVSLPDMTLEDYQSIMRQCKDKVFQVALGGRGDPDCHQDFEAILYESRNANIVPNITTSGFSFTPEKAKLTAKYCGGAAVSWYETKYTYSALDNLLSAGATTNIHFILSEKSISRAVEMMEAQLFPKGIRAVIFLLYKPVGYQRHELVLKKDNPYIKPFFDLMNKNEQPYLMGFDSCLAPGVLNNCSNAAPECLEPCESSRFSAYISSQMKMYPCSFVQKEAYETDLKKVTIQKAWKSEVFDKFRNILRSACPSCEKRELCLGGCPDLREINLCNTIYEEVKR